MRFLNITIKESTSTEPQWLTIVSEIMMNTSLTKYSETTHLKQQLESEKTIMKE